MTRSWVSGSKSTDAADKLEADLKGLEAEKAKIIDENKVKFSRWAALVIKCLGTEKIGKLGSDSMTAEINKVLDELDALDEQITQKQGELSQQIENQVRSDFLG